MERLQKYLAGAGVASRRKAEELIAAGRVEVNGRVVTELGTKVDPEVDRVVLDGKPVGGPQGRRYLLLYKPPGCVTTMSDPQGRPTAASYLAGVRERVFPVGRLDYDAEGAVLFTTDGELANRLAHPRYGHRRVYLVKVKGDASAGAAPGTAAALAPRLEDSLARLREGVRLEDGPAKALSVEIHERTEKNVWLRVEVGEGRYHLVKRLCEAVGLTVLRLFRPEFGGVSVQGLRPGTFRDLTPEELRATRALVGLEGRRGEHDVSGIDEAREAPPRRPLPKAARRHGHGPPAPKASPAPSPSLPRSAGEGKRSGEESERRGAAPAASARPERRGGPPAAAGRPERRGGPPSPPRGEGRRQGAPAGGMPFPPSPPRGEGRGGAARKPPRRR